MSSFSGNFSSVLRKGGQSQQGVVYGRRVRVNSGSTPFSTKQERWYNRTGSPVDFIKTDARTGAYVLKSRVGNQSLGALYRKHSARSEKGYLARFLRRKGILSPAPRKTSKQRASERNFLQRLANLKAGSKLGGAISKYKASTDSVRFGSQKSVLSTSGRGKKNRNPFASKKTKNTFGSNIAKIVSKSRFGTIRNKSGSSESSADRKGSARGAVKKTYESVKVFRAGSARKSASLSAKKPRSGSGRNSSGSSKSPRIASARKPKSAKPKRIAAARMKSIRGASKGTSGTRSGSSRGSNKSNRAGSPRSGSARPKTKGKVGRPKDPNAVRNRRVYGTRADYTAARRSGKTKGKGASASFGSAPKPFKGI
jgi:hypothetical protein